MNAVRIRLLASVLGVGAALAGCASQGPGPIEVEGPYTHRASGMVFPEKIRDFARTEVTRFDGKAELDIGVGYRRGGRKRVDVTAYVYPLPAGTDVNGACENEYAIRKTEIAGRPGTLLVSEDPTLLVRGVPEGRRVLFGFTAQGLESVLSFYCPVHSRWILKYRATYRVGALSLDELQEIFAEIAKPLGPPIKRR